MNSKALNHWRWKIFGVVCLVVIQGVLAPVASQANAAGKAERKRQETASQQALRKVMEDIRHCNKTVRYEYDPKSGRTNPPELEKIKGLKLKEIVDSEYAVFEIKEVYEMMRITHILTRVTGSSHSEGSLVTVLINGSYLPIRRRLEEAWGVKFKEGEPPMGPDDIVGEKYAELAISLNEERRIIAINWIPDASSSYGKNIVSVDCGRISN